MGTVVLQPVRSRLGVVGSAVSEDTIHLSARISAYVKQVHVSAGDRITRGQPLIALDDREIRERLAGAEVQLAQARREHERATRLFEQKATTEQALTAATAALSAAEAAARGVQVQLTDTQILAPINGIVADRHIEVGDLANPGATLLTVHDPARMRLEAPVPVWLMHHLSLDCAVDVELDRPAGVITGRVIRIFQAVDPLSRTQMTHVWLPEAAANVLPGTFGRLRIAGDERPALLAPRSAIYSVGQLEMVDVVRGDRVVRRLVRTAGAFGDQVEVLSGLEAGERVLLRPTPASAGAPLPAAPEKG